MSPDPVFSGVDSIVEAVLELVSERVPTAQKAAAESFARPYFAGTAVEDLQDRSIVDLYGAALSHFNFAHQRRPGKPKVRVYNPVQPQHGWRSTHTIVEVVSDDMPFLVDSVRMALNRRSLTTHLVIHPVMRAHRDASGVLTGPNGEEAITEAVIHVEVDRQTEERVLDDIAADIRSVLEDVRGAVEDWQPMHERLRGVLTELESNPPPLDESELARGRAFLEWVSENHFTFLGYREYELLGGEGEERLRSVGGSGFGLLRESEPRESTAFASLSPQIRRLAREPRLLLITKANARSTVHRPGYLDYIGIKTFDSQGRVTGERRFLGLYTSAAYNQVPRAIPLLREKVARVMERATYPSNSHAAKALLHILETFPRDLLFQVSDDELYETGMGILHLQERQRIRLFVHRDRIGRFVSCIVYVPRERFNTQVRLKIQNLLAEALGARDVEFTVHLSESVLARLYFVFRVLPAHVVSVEVDELEARLSDYTRDWRDDLYEELLDHCGEELGVARFRRYGEAFSADYQANYSARVAVHDIDSMEDVGGAGDAVAMSLYRPLEAAPDVLHFKLFRPEQPISLSDALPVLENMGLIVETGQPARIERADRSRMWMHDFGMRAGESLEVDIDRVREKFQEAFERIWAGDAENDGFNRLVLRAGLGWREIAVLRAYCKYLRQAGTTFSQEYMEAALAGNTAIAQALVRLFHIRFDPSVSGDREALGQVLVEEIRGALDAVANLDEDRILRSFLGLMRATLRTNFYQRRENGEVKPCLSFKFDPARVAELPEPRPRYEIFVYSPRVEGVHLRGGAVARGGIRWSDRREDFRTEVLGLVKAQMVKNSVIVPVGSKGGFVPKRMPAGGDREAVQAEGITCYEIFIGGMLDLTDNLSDAEVVPPADVVRHDGNDPYLVVAADKGTATFSDIANRLAARYRFWLGDAFASGGLSGLRPQGHGHHRAWGMGVGQAPLPRARHRRPEHRIHRDGDRRHGWGRVRQRHAAFGAHSPHRCFQSPAHLHRSQPAGRFGLSGAHTPVRAAALELGRLRPRFDFGGRRCLRAQRQIDRPVPAGARGLRYRRVLAHSQPAHPRHALCTGRSPLERRDRHLCQGELRAPGRGGRSGQRCAAGRRIGVALQGDRRGGQPRLHPAREGGVRRARRQGHHRCDRQLRRRGLLGPRGEHQDPAERRGRRRGHDREAAQPPARGDDGRGGGTGVAQQLSPDPGPQRGGVPVDLSPGSACASDACARAKRRSRSGDRVPARRGRDRGAGFPRPRTHCTGTLGPHGLREDHLVQVSARSWPRR